MDDEEAEIAKQLLEAAYILPRTVDVAEVQYTGGGIRAGEN